MTKQSKHVASYPPAFRAEAIRLARTSGKPHAQIARDLGMTSETLRLWLKQADLDEGQRSDGLTSDEQAELRRLRRENRILREERAILKQAAAHLSGRRPARCGESVRVRRTREGQSHRRHPLPCAGRLPRAALGRGANAISRLVLSATRGSLSRSGRFIRRAVARMASRGSRPNWSQRGPGVDASASRAACVDLASIWPRWLPPPPSVPHHAARSSG
jgi:transposase